MLTREELVNILRPIIQNGVNQTVQASSGNLPPTHAVINQQAADTTNDAITAILQHLPASPRNLTAEEGFIFPQDLPEDGNWAKAEGTLLAEGEEQPNEAIHVRRYVTCWRPVEDSTLNTEAIVVRGAN